MTFKDYRRLELSASPVRYWTTIHLNSPGGFTITFTAHNEQGSRSLLATVSRSHLEELDSNIKNAVCKCSCGDTCNRYIDSPLSYLFCDVFSYP